MPSTVDLGWSVQDAVDVLAYAQTLPTGEEVPDVLPVTGGNALPLTTTVLFVVGLVVLCLGLFMLMRDQHQKSRIP